MKTLKSATARVAISLLPRQRTQHTRRCQRRHAGVRTVTRSVVRGAMTSCYDMPECGMTAMTAARRAMAVFQDGTRWTVHNYGVGLA